MITEIIAVVKEFDPGVKQLRAFGIFSGLVLIVLYFTYIPSVFLLVLSIGAIVLAGFTPQIYLPITKFLIAVTYPIGWIVSRVLLIVFFFGVLTPVGMVHRLFDRKRWLNSNQKSYWSEVEQNVHHDRMSL